MAAKKLYGSFAVNQRKTRLKSRLLGVSHSVKRLRRIWGNYPVFQVRENGSNGSAQFEAIGKEIVASAR